MHCEACIVLSNVADGATPMYPFRESNGKLAAATAVLGFFRQIIAIAALPATILVGRVLIFSPKFFLFTSSCFAITLIFVAIDCVRTAKDLQKTEKIQHVCSTKDALVKIIRGRPAARVPCCVAQIIASCLTLAIGVNAILNYALWSVLAYAVPILFIIAPCILLIVSSLDLVLTLGRAGRAEKDLELQFSSNLPSYQKSSPYAKSQQAGWADNYDAGRLGTGNSWQTPYGPSGFSSKENQTTPEMDNNHATTYQANYQSIDCGPSMLPPHFHVTGNTPRSNSKMTPQLPSPFYFSQTSSSYK